MIGNEMVADPTSIGMKSNTAIIHMRRQTGRNRKDGRKLNLSATAVNSGMEARSRSTFKQKDFAKDLYSFRLIPVDIINTAVQASLNKFQLPSLFFSFLVSSFHLI
jgi:hypothetical protein